MRTHVEEHSFTESLTRLFPDPELADQVLNSIAFVLGRCPNPLVYPLVRNLPDRGSLMAYVSRKTIAHPCFVVLFTCEQDVIHLHDIWGSLPDDEEG